jgi:hypothetical protein
MSVSTNNESLRNVNFGWIQESFEIFKRDIGVWVLALVIYGAISAALSGTIEGLFGMTGHDLFTSGFTPGAAIPSLSPTAQFYTPAYYAFLTVSGLLQLPVAGFFLGGLFKMANKAVRQQPLELGDVFSGSSTIVSFTVFYFIFIIVFELSLVIGILFGGFVVLGLLFPTFAILADGETVPSAMTKSFDGMKRDWLGAAAFTFVFSLLTIISLVVCCFCIPYFITTPMSFILSSLAYRDMIGFPPSVMPVAEAPAPDSWPPPPTIPAAAPAPPPEQPVEEQKPMQWPPRAAEKTPEDSSDDSNSH